MEEIKKGKDGMLEIPDIISWAKEHNLKWKPCHKKKVRLIVLGKADGKTFHTIDSNGKDESDRLTKDGEVIVCNATNRKNQWPVDLKTLKRKYRQVSDNEWVTKGDTMLFTKSPFDEPVRFKPPHWGGGSAILQPDSYLMKDPKNEKDIYPISSKDFETYEIGELKESKNDKQTIKLTESDIQKIVMNTIIKMMK